MNSVLLTCLIIFGVLVVGYLVYMAIGMFLFNRAAKQHGVQRTIIEIKPKRDRKGKTKKSRRKWTSTV